MKISYKNILFFFFAIIGICAAEAQTSLKVMNYNCRMSGDMVGYSAIPFANFIRKYKPDVVMLQEVDYMTARNKGQDFATQLGAELGMFSTFGYALKYETTGEYGVAILSKYPFELINNQPFGIQVAGMLESRTLLYVDITLPESNKTIRIGCTHLDHSTDAVRSAMAAEINNRIGDSKMPTLLAGDFNARPADNVIATVMSNWQRICTNDPTYPANVPTAKIDYIFGLPKNDWTVKSYTVVSNSEISDHCATIAEVEYNK